MSSSSVGRFRLSARVAAGGMGEVWRGVETGAGGVERPAAIKRIAPELARHQDFVRTFVDEAKLSFQLCHENVVQVRDIGFDEGDCFIAMEWVEGADLATLLDRCKKIDQPLPLRFAILIAACAARGLDYAHRLRSPSGQPLALVHRDVSPTNLLLSVEGEVKVTDFGIARFRLRETISVPGMVKGKAAYMAPEQARGEEVDARADVFALGVVLYEMATGQNPFSGSEERDVDVLARLKRGAVRPPGELAQLPSGLEAIVLRAMAPERDQRYVSCAALGEDLEALARREAWSLSASALALFVRSVIAEEAALADTERHPELKRRTPPAAPRPFDAALGAELAALSGAGTPPRATMVGKRASPVPPPSETPAPEREPSAHALIDLDRAPARSGPRFRVGNLAPRKGWGWWVGGTFLITFIGLGALARVVARGPEATPAAPVAAPAQPAATAAPAPAPAAAKPAPASPIPATAPAATAPLHHHPARAAEPARLTVVSDVPANVFVDGRFVYEAPLTDWRVSAGAHRVRVEGSSAGLRLLPKEETVKLKDGEPKRLEIDLMKNP